MIERKRKTLLSSLIISSPPEKKRVLYAHDDEPLGISGMHIDCYLSLMRFMLNLNRHWTIFHLSVAVKEAYILSRRVFQVVPSLRGSGVHLTPHFGGGAEKATLQSGNSSRGFRLVLVTPEQESLSFVYFQIGGKGSESQM